MRAAQLLGPRLMDDEPGAADRLFDEPGLADAGFALDHHHPAPAAQHRGCVGAQRRQLRCTTHEGGRGNRSAPRW
jgi:hypothetical protein